MFFIFQCQCLNIKGIASLLGLQSSNSQCFIDVDNFTQKDKLYRQNEGKSRKKNEQIIPWID